MDAIQQARLQNKLKVPSVAILLGLIIPGAGQIYAGSVIWGVANLMLTIIFGITIVASPISFFIWFLSMFFGYKAAKAYNETVLDEVEAKNKAAGT